MSRDVPVVSDVVSFAADVATGGAYSASRDAKRAREQAEAQAAAQREALAALESEPVPVVPLADDVASQRAKRRSISAQLRRRGRASTILTNPAGSEALGA